MATNYLMHAWAPRKGTTWKNHKYIAKEKVGGGRIRYFYTAAELAAFNRKKEQIRDLLRKKNNGVDPPSEEKVAELADKMLKQQNPKATLVSNTANRVTSNANSATGVSNNVANATAERANTERARAKAVRTTAKVLSEKNESSNTTSTPVKTAESTKSSKTGSTKRRGSSGSSKTTEKTPKVTKGNNNDKAPTARSSKKSNSKKEDKEEKTRIVRPEETKADTSQYVKRIKLADGTEKVFYSEEEYENFAKSSLDNLPVASETKTPDELKDTLNPNFNLDDPNTSMNCIYCSVAYDLAKRGYDVKALEKESESNLYDLLSWYSDFEPKYNNSGGIDNTRDFIKTLQEFNVYSRAIDYGTYDINYNTDYRPIEKELSKLPDGAYGQMLIWWRGGGAHSVIWEVHDGEPVIIDSQSHETYKLDHLDGWFNAMIPIRLDDKTPDNDILQYVQPDTAETRKNKKA